MNDTESFGLLILLTSGALLAAVLANRHSARIRVPLPVVFLVVAAVIARVFNDVHPPEHRTVERLVTIALLMILFDGGLHIGWSRFRQAAGPIVLVGVLGTLSTAAATAALAHWAFGLSWYVALLLATAVAPTDPAVVFSVLGQRQISGRSSTILEGESGANDPVGIALMSSLIAAGGLSVGAFESVGVQFTLQMLGGALVGVAGGKSLVWYLRRASLPSEALYPLLTLAWALVLFGFATVAHGSGFLAVFIAGIVLGDARAPYKREIERFHSALASLGEIVAFIVLGLTLDITELAQPNVLVPGLIIGAVLGVVIRPALVGLCLLGSGLSRNERSFVLFAGLKGAVPILLGSFILQAGIADAERIYGIVAVVVVSSVIVQGTLVPTVAAKLRLSMRTVEPEPWALGVRLRDEPHGVHRLRVAAGAPADGQTIGGLRELPEDVWVSFVVRDSKLLAVRDDTRLQAGDEVLVLADPSVEEALAATFEHGLRAPPE